MARNVRGANVNAAEAHKHWHKKLMLLGVGFFLTGFLRFLGFDWNWVLMILGALMVIKGLVMGAKK